MIKRPFRNTELMFPSEEDKFHLDGAIMYSCQYLEELSGRTAIVVGAHVGTTVLSLKNFKDIHAFEGDTENFECLKKNVSCQVYNEIISDKEEGFDLADGNFSTNSGAKYFKPGNKSAKTIDSYNFKDVDLILVDVEGMDLKVLKGAEETIKKYRPRIIVEFKHLERYGDSWPKAINYMRSLGYEKASLPFGPTLDREFNYGHY